jgi:hypothetical protein
MSSKFANRRKPRKVGGDDSEEEDSGFAPGMFTMPELIALREQPHPGPKC